MYAVRCAEFILDHLNTTGPLTERDVKTWVQSQMIFNPNFDVIFDNAFSELLKAKRIEVYSTDPPVSYCIV